MKQQLDNIKAGEFVSWRVHHMPENKYSMGLSFLEQAQKK